MKTQIRRHDQSPWPAASSSLFGLFFGVQSYGLDLGHDLQDGSGLLPAGPVGHSRSAWRRDRRALRCRPAPRTIGSYAWRGMLFILPAPIFFGLTVRGLGFVPSIFLTTLIAALASLKMKLPAALLLALAVTVFSTLVFSYAPRPAVPALRPLAAVLRSGPMDLLSNLALGFATAASPENLFFCLIGVLLGTLIGVLPGIGATATIAMLLPITFQIGEPVSSLIMLAGIYYGAQYGGSTTAILINMPGESSRP